MRDSHQSGSAHVCSKCQEHFHGYGELCHTCSTQVKGDPVKAKVAELQQNGYVGPYTLLVKFVENCHEEDVIGDDDKEVLLTAVKDLNSGSRTNVNFQQSFFRDYKDLAQVLPGLGIQLKEEEPERQEENKGTPCPCGATFFGNGVTFCFTCGGTEELVMTSTQSISGPSEIIFPQESCSNTRVLRSFDMNVWDRGHNIKEDVQMLLTCFKQPFDIVMRHHIRRDALGQWIEAIAEQYHRNTYHNWRHAFDVMQFSYVHMTMGKAGKYFFFRDMLALFIAQLSHDVAHPGVNNNFLVLKGDDLALTYNDLSPLENMHAHVCFQTMRRPGHNVMETLTSDVFTHVRSRIIDAILATDMKEHYQLVEKLQDATAREDTTHDEKEDRRLLVKAFTHMADLGHNARPWRYHKLITIGLEEEQFMQGDQERAMGWPTITPLMDRRKESDSLGAVQKFFMEVMIMPLLAPFQKLLTEDKFEEARDGLLDNASKWNSLVEKHGKLKCKELVDLDR